MSQIVNFLKNNPHENVEVTAECDDICRCCPHENRGRCKDLLSDWMIKRMDKRVIKKLKIDNDTPIMYEDIAELVNRSFKTIEDLKGICSGCQWKDKCSWYLQKSEFSIAI